MKSKNTVVILAVPARTEIIYMSDIVVGAEYSLADLSKALGYVGNSVYRELYFAHRAGKTSATLRGYRFALKGDAAKTAAEPEEEEVATGTWIIILDTPAEDSGFERISGIKTNDQLPLGLFVKHLGCHPNAPLQALYRTRKKGKTSATLRGYRFCYLKDFETHS